MADTMVLSCLEVGAVGVVLLKGKFKEVTAPFKAWSLRSKRQKKESLMSEFSGQIFKVGLGLPCYFMSKELPEAGTRHGTEAPAPSSCVIAKGAEMSLPTPTPCCMFPFCLDLIWATSGKCSPTVLAHTYTHTTLVHQSTITHSFEPIKSHSSRSRTLTPPSGMKSKL